MKNDVFWNMTPCGSCKNRCFERTWKLLVTDEVPSSLILSTLEMEATHSSGTSELTITTLCFVPEDGILQNY
jgi:hypothetical protein